MGLHDELWAPGDEGLLVVDPEGGGARRVLATLAGATGGGDAVLHASWRRGLLRPFGGLLDVIEDLAAWVQPRQPELLQRFGWSLVNLLYPWRRAQAAFPVGELRAGLADFVLRGDQNLIHQFFQKRNVRPQILSSSPSSSSRAPTPSPRAAAAGSGSSSKTSSAPTASP
jgi:hypothetical protein